MITTRHVKQWLKVLALTLLSVALMSFWKYSRTTENDLRSVVFRYELQERTGLRILSINQPGNLGKDPDAEVMRQLGDFKDRIRKASESDWDSKGCCRDKLTKQSAPCITVGSMKRVSSTEVHVSGSTRIGDMGGDYYDYILRRRFWSWHVVKRINTGSS